MRKFTLKTAAERKAGFRKLYFALVILATAAAIVLINLLADQLPWSYDMTSERLFTLSEQTKTVLAGLEDEVNIIILAEEGNEDRTIQALLDEYRKYGKGLISVETIDADRNPAVVRKYDTNDEGISNGSIVFENGGKIMTVSQFDIYILNDYALGKTFNGEQQFTGAIIRVTSDELPTVYFLEGHGEPDINVDLSRLAARIETEAHIVKSLNLQKEGSIPKDAGCLIVAFPKTDLSNDEKELMRAYLFEGGRAIILFDILSQEDQMANFNGLLKFYGIQYANNFVVEESSQNLYSGNKMYLIPQYNIQHDIVRKLNTDRLFVLMPFASSLEILSDRDRTINAEPLLLSSEKSWIRYNLEDATATQTQDDVSGPAMLAVAISRNNADLRHEDTRIVVTGDAGFVDNEFVDIQGNFNLFLNALHWAEDRGDAITIRPKTMNTNILYVQGDLYNVVLIVSVLVLPLLAFLTGLIVWLRRRHL